MGVYEGRGNLSKAMKDLVLRWNETKMSWDDSRSDSLEKDFLEPLQQDLRMAVTAMDQAAILLRQVERDCE